MYNLYSRIPGSNRTGGKFDAQTIAMVWNKGFIVPGYDPNVYRKDACGAWMIRSEYGNINSAYGWEIDHIKPVSHGGDDYIHNLQPLQWQNNRHKSDNYPHWYCKLRA